MKPYTLITGASRGLGLALAHRFAQNGHPLLLAARSGPALQEAAIALQSKHHVDVKAFAADLSHQQGVEELIKACEPFAIDSLINNAGFGLGNSFAEQDPRALQQMLFLNIQALTQLSRHYAPQIKAHKGVLLNVASQAGFQAMPYFAAYAASKAYVLHLTEALHHELKPHGVRVMALCPGATATDFFNQAGINTQDTLLRPGSVKDVIDAAMDGLQTGQAVVLPGASNKAVTFVQRFISRRLGVKISARLMGR